MMVNGANLKMPTALPTGLSITSNVGSVDVPDVILTLTGQEIAASQGEAFNPVVIETTLSSSFSVGVITPNDQTQGLSCRCNQCQHL